MGGPEIAVVIPTHQRRDLVLRVLASLAAQRLDIARYEVCLVCDGCSDGTALLTRQIYGPKRARGLMAQADMEHAGFGLSQWQPAVDGVRYRLSSGQSTVFLPGDARAATVPLRPVGTGRTLEVQLRLDGQPADSIRIPPDRWYELRLMLPQSEHGRRFRRLDLDIAGAPAAGPDLLMIGKVQRR